jgi:L-xylulokinase
MMNSLYCINGFYLIEECSPTSMGNLAWMKEQIMPDIPSYPAFIEMAEKVAPDEQQLIFLPFIFGSNYNPLAKAVLLGMDGSHTRNHIARAILEGICFCHKVHVNKLLAHRKSTKAIRLAGGAAQSRLCAQLFADILELPVELIATDELGALGAAMAAAVGAGEYPSFHEAAKAMVTIKGRIKPCRRNFAVYRKKYALYTQAANAVEGLWG